MIRKVVLASLMTVCSTIAVAGSHTWNFANLHSLNSTGNGYVASIGSNNSGMNVQVSAWSSSGGTGKCDQSSVYGTNQQVVGTDYYSCIEDARIKSFGGGLGVVNQYENEHDSPDHAIDNIYNSGDYDFDMVLFTFDSAVKLTDVKQGWKHTDADMSVLAYTGNTAFNTGSFFGKNWQNILNDGWSVVNNFSELDDKGYGDFVVDDASPYSKHWLVGAYNNVFGGKWTSQNDAFKLQGLTVVKQGNFPDSNADNNEVNAPATLTMLLAILGLMAYRRKN